MRGIIDRVRKGSFIPYSSPVIFLAGVLACWVASAGESGVDVTRKQVLHTMKTATRYMVDNVSHQGGYVWIYEPDLSRRWGELEATSTMIWMQPPGTPSMGHQFLDAYAVTGDRIYLEAAEQVASVLVRGQLPAGGWNYFFDLAGEEAAREWYGTVGANAWRMEEFHHYYGNATFDDSGTIEAASFLLRMHLLDRGDRYRAPLDKTIGFILASQHAVGGWPQRYPPTDEHRFHGLPDYSGLITLNDGVALRNIQFLLACYLALGREDLLEPIHRAMYAFIPLQLGQPQPGWALQYDLLLKPAGARSYEPASLSPPTTAQVISMLLRFHRLTADSRFLAGIPDAIAWLKQLRLPDNLVRNGRAYPRIVELGSNRPLYLHRRGSNVVNGEYYVDYTPGHTVVHYSSTGRLDIVALEREYLEALESAPGQSIFKTKVDRGDVRRRLVASRDGLGELLGWRSGLGADPCFRREPSLSKVEDILAALNPEGYWPRISSYSSNPYTGAGSDKPNPGDFGETWVGDSTDTSTNCLGEPRPVISTTTYLVYMNKLTDWLRERPITDDP